MKKFKVTVNGKAYEVEVEEIGSPVRENPVTVRPNSAPAVAAPTPAPAPVTTDTTVSAVSKGPVPAGAITVKSPMPGKISAVKAKSGDKVKRGDVLVVLEAMKMQNDITAAADGTLYELRVQVGDNVRTGDILAVITQ